MARRVLVGLFLTCAVGCTLLTQKSEPDPKNELPFGFVDEPKGGTAIDRNMPSHGWALDDNSVTEVRVFMDDHFLARASLTEMRPDVTKAFPKYAHGNDVHGWNLTVPLPAGVTLGPHTLIYQAVDNQGATKDFATVYVRLEQ